MWNLLLILLFSILSTDGTTAPRKKTHSTYRELLKPVDLYAVPQGTTRLMKLGELYQTILQRSLPVKQASYDLSIAREVYSLSYHNLTIPRFTLGVSYAPSQTAAGGNSSTSLALTATGSNAYGFNYSVDFPRLSRSLSSFTSSDGNFFQSELDTAFVGATIAFSLLKGSWFLLGSRLFEEADVAMEAAKHANRSAILTSLAAAEQAFFDVLLKQIRVSVLKNSVESSRALLNDVKEMIRVGETEKLAIVKVELQIAQAETDLLQGQMDLVNAKQALRELTGTEDSAEMFPDPNDAKTLPSWHALTVAQALERAKRTRAEWHNAVTSRKQSEIQVELARANLFPKLDVSFSYGYGGTKSTFNEAFNELKKFDPPQYSVGIAFSCELFDETGKSAYRQAKVKLQKAELGVEQLENQMTKEITTALQSIELGNRKLQTSGLARELSEKKLNAEFDKFMVGESGLRDITDYQKEVDGARIAELGARVDLLKQLASLRTAIGEFPEGLKP